MKITRIVIIDDEQDARESLEQLVDLYCPNFKIIGKADSVKSGIKMIDTLIPDVILLDIKLGDGSGFDLINHFSKPSFKVIFTTAFDQFAIKAFRYNALDYLLKPINPDELHDALKKTVTLSTPFVNEAMQNLLSNLQTKTFNKIAIHTSEGRTFIKIEDIIYLKSEGNYTSFYLNNDKPILVSKAIKEYENILDDRLFFRTHQSFIINIQYLSKVLKEDGGLILLENGIKIPLSRRRKDDFMSFLKTQFY